MADNVEVTAGSGTTIAADDIGGVLHQRVKISQGADGSATDVSSAAPLQVTVANTGANATPIVVDLGANNDVTVTSGTITTVTSVTDIANTVTVDNAGTFAVQDADVLAAIEGTVAHDDPVTQNPSLVAGYASAAAPTSVSADGDLVRFWALRNGAQATVITAAGALIGGDATNGLDVDVTRMSALVAGTALIGKASVGLDTSTIYDGATALTPKFAVVSCSSSGDNEIVAAVTSKKIRVLQWIVTASAAVNFKWQSATAGDKTGLFYAAAAGGGAGGAFNPVGHFETASGEALQLNLSGATAVGGSIVYVEV